MALKLRQHERLPAPSKEQAGVVQWSCLPGHRGGTTPTLPRDVQHWSAFCQLSEGRSLMVWETVITLYARELPRSHIPRYPCGPEQHNKCSTPEDWGRAVRQWRAVMLSPRALELSPPSLNLPIQHPNSSSRARPLLMGHSPGLGNALQLPQETHHGAEHHLTQRNCPDTRNVQPELHNSVHSFSLSRAEHLGTKALSPPSIKAYLKWRVFFIPDCCPVSAPFFACTFIMQLFSPSRVMTTKC